jgi:DNA (cytosine-5)-methyltransferase 1
MTHGSLFSGIGGFDLAAEWMGWENKFHCEWNEFGQKVLKYYWPESELFTDITKSDFTKYADKIDVLTGGFPCQPYSMAGKRLGKEDDRHLWPEMLRVIKEVKPRWVIGENVLGLVNWNGGLVFHEVQTDLEAQGYEVFPYVLPAVSVNAPHRRDRVFFVAYSSSIGFCKHSSNEQLQPSAFRTQFGLDKKNATNSDSNGFNQCDSNNEIKPSQGGFNALSNFDESIIDGDFANTKSLRINRKEEHENNSGQGGKRRGCDLNNISEIQRRDFAADTQNIRRKDALENRELERRRLRKSYQRNFWDSFPSVSPICTGDDGLSDQLDSITFSKWRRESIKAGGNAIVPQVVYQIFKTIELYEHKRASDTTGPSSM